MDAKELYLKETGKDRTRSCYERIPSVTEHYISWLETKVTEQHQALQLQQAGVSTCFLEDVTDDVFNMGYKQVSCCKIAPITNENYCPNCGKNILK